MKFQVMVILIASTLFVGCGGQSGGLAPSRDILPTLPITDVSGDSNLKYGESVSSINGWEVSIDTTDPIEEVTLANSWNVEVKYE